VGIETVKTRTSTIRVTTRTLLLLFIALLAMVAGVFNLRDRVNQKPVPTDGVIWVDRPGMGVVAERIEPGGPVARLHNIYRGDILYGISTDGGRTFDEITRAYQVQIYLDQVKDQIKEGYPLSYLIVRKNDAADTIIKEGIADLDSLDVRSPNLARGFYLALIGLIYLGIGIYVLVQQGRAPYVTHFFLVCLLAFIVHCYSPTEELRTQFDKAIDLADIFALILLAPAFMHFAAIYPARHHLFNRRRWLAALLYAPAALMIAGEIVIHFEKLRSRLPISEVGFRDGLERSETAVFAISLLASGALLLRTFRRARIPTVRQQLKWVVWGLSIAAFSFAAFYVPSFIAGSSVSALLEALAIAPLVLIPLTLGYSIARYRLTDVDIVVRRSVAYIIATLSVAVLFGSVMVVSYEFLTPLLPASATLLIAAILMSAIAMFLAPMKNWVQERIDRLFYGEKYDYRMTLQDFGRTLSSTTDLDVLLDSLTRRLKEVLSVERLAIFIEDRRASSGFRLARAERLDREISLPADFLNTLREHSGTTGIVKADEIEASAEASETGEAAASTPRRLLYYYVPCAVRSRVVAVIGLGRGVDGALLSSEDTALLRAISGYVAVAIENALLLEEQAQRAQELARLKEFNENIIESINVGVMVINLSGRIINWNGALEEIYGLKREAAIGRRIPEVFQAEMLHALREMMARSEWQKDEPVNVYKFRARSVDDRELTLNISLAPLHTKTDEIEGTLVAIEDVTERVHLEEQVQQAEKLSSIGLLAAGVAHEVNTPLTGISSYAQMLMQQVPESDPRHQLLEKIRSQTSRASAIVNNLLNFSRTSDARFTDVNLHRVLEDTIQLLEAQLRHTQIEVARRYAEQLPPAPGNAAKLQQVFMNLILNARDAMPQGGRLEISTAATEATVAISFRDTGIGISPEHLSKIYDPFFTTKQIGLGTGLGLAVSYGIIKDHGGNIQVESKPGDGTLFQITLPLASARQQLATASD
jgi:hypothetical protein